ncbi:MAG: hypothetical protein MHM6MM_003013 [Cercozoa sp. M6MM]
MLAIASLLLATDDSFRSESCARMHFSVLIGVMPLLPADLLDSPVLQEAMMTSLASVACENYERLVDLPLAKKWVRTCQTLIDRGAKANKNTCFFLEPLTLGFYAQRDVAVYLADNMVYKDTAAFLCQSTAICHAVGGVQRCQGTRRVSGQNDRCGV